jgi:RimJ/RimL family protein N-acetyltransferase
VSFVIFCEIFCVFSASVSTNYPTMLRTRRLILRQWQESDFLPYARLNADQRVMEFMLGTMTEEETRQSIENIEKHFDAHGFGRWAVEIAESEKFIGFVGINIPTYTLPFSPCVEVAWRICANEWGKGYAPEAANEAMRDGFERVGLQEIVSFTTLTNLKSRRVMEKLGMQYCPAEDFDHPMVSEGHHLRRHVLYRMSKADWNLRP